MMNTLPDDRQDITHEAWRQYDFFGPAGMAHVRIDSPTQLSVRPDGHHILDGQGVVHHVPFGWIHMSWKQVEGQQRTVQ